MSVYKRPGSATYSYDFRLSGRRFSGDTGTAQKREALKAEESARLAAKAKIAEASSFFAEDMPLDVAASRYWLEVGQHHKNAVTTLWSMQWLLGTLGAKTMLSAIDDNQVAMIVAKRRAEFVPHRKAKKLVGPATVNRTAIEPLRKILTRASKVWGIRLPPIKWATHKLKEPQERVREASAGEEARIMGKLGRGYEDAVAFAFLTGCRRAEIVGLEWRRVDFFGRIITVVGKGDKSRTIPMTQDLFDLLWEQRDRHPIAVFTYRAARTDKRKGRIKGTLYPITAYGLQTAVRRAVPRAGVKDFRFHDMRHTAATRVLRKSNIRVVQRLLGHESVETTARYAHAAMSDLLTAMEAASPTKITTADEATADKPLKKTGNPG